MDLPPLIEARKGPIRVPDLLRSVAKLMRPDGETAQTRRDRLIRMAAKLDRLADSLDAAERRGA